MRRELQIMIGILLTTCLLAACQTAPAATTIPATMPPSQTSTTGRTPAPAATVPSPVSGSVELAGGACCAGGTADDSIEVAAAFAATSAAGSVDAMRVLTGGMCFGEADVATAAWEPFVPTRQYPVNVAINWVGFYLSVQYRDDQGNLSPVVCDDIGIEGSPPRSP